MIVSLIAAMDADGRIGKAGGLPWPKLSRDMKRFREITMGKSLIMGRKTVQSLGGPLADRFNIVLTRDPDCCAAGFHVAHSVAEALRMAEVFAGPDGEAIVIGGAEVYRAMMPHVTRAYLTFVGGEFEGDTYFPNTEFEAYPWTLESFEHYRADVRNPHVCQFAVASRPMT